MAKTFLVIEDNFSDATLIKRAFGSIDSCSAFICRNVSEAKDYIRGAGMYQDRGQFPFPNAIICDLRLGAESGTEFLSWVKDNAEFKNLPVIILSGAPTSQEATTARKLGALDVFTKPARYEDLQKMLTDLASKLCG